MKAVILAAGRGKRFGDLTIRVPKPLILVGKKPLIVHVFDNLPECITEYLVIIGYLGDMIKETLGSKYRGKPIRYVWQEKSGTGGALLSAKSLLSKEERFFVIGSDDIFGRGELGKLIQDWPTYGVHYGPLSKLSKVRVLFNQGNFFKGFEAVSDATAQGYRGVGAYVLPCECLQVEMFKFTNGEMSLPHSLSSMKFPIKTVEIDNWFPVNDEYEREIAEKILHKI